MYCLEAGDWIPWPDQSPKVGRGLTRSPIGQGAKAIKWGLSMRALLVNTLTFSLVLSWIMVTFMFSQEFWLLLFWFAYLFNFPLHSRTSLPTTNLSENLMYQDNFT